MDILKSGVEVTNPFDETILHEHVCRNCSVKFYCSLPDCMGDKYDPQLCPDCFEVLGEIW